MERPVIGITMGDPAGVGPEIAAKVLADEDVFRTCLPVVIGDAGVMRRAAEAAGIARKIRVIHEISQSPGSPGDIEVLDCGNVEPASLVYGKVDAAMGKAAVEYVRQAVSLALTGRIRAIVTCPIHKEAIRAAGCPHAGHTELLAHLTGAREHAMMLVVDGMRIVHVTTHVPLRDACDLVRKERVLAVIRLTAAGLQGLGISRQRIAVAGLNPHCGEGGLFGKEEAEEIAPAVRQARDERIDVEGPIPPDTVFAKAEGGMYDAVVAMYHDQGHIPAKLQGFKWRDGGWVSMGGVNVTLGLPVIRTSVDHGTAFDIAWKGIAVPQSLRQAIAMAALMAKNDDERRGTHP